ncbi:NAD(P)-binding protein [Cadophora sp. DSE1049]|nr:NAD(P)-binding protein [Cadophora sp. DSE1049]
MGGGQNNESEERQGKGLIDAALKNGIKMFVYSSVDRGGSKSDNNPTSVPHFISKHKIEQYLFDRARGTDMSYTVLRPVAFFENLIPGFVGKVFTTSWRTSLRKEQKLQLIATSDIGFFGAEAFLKPDEYSNKKLSIAGDELTFDQFKDIFEKQTGEPLPTTYNLVAGVLNRAVKDLGYMFKWFRDVGYGADIPRLKTLNPELKGFETWLATESAWKRK